VPSMKYMTSNPGFVPLESLKANSQPQDYWQSLDEPGRSLEHLDSEQLSEEGIELSDESRRRFLSLMAGSLALAGLTGCTRQPAETILPYVEPPENVVPGRPKYYATAVPVNGIAQGVIVESHLGRPTKVEGNPDHPASLGASSIHSQACLMDLYDPDRAKEISYLGGVRTWEAFQIAWNSAMAPIRQRKGEGFRILTETVVSPTLGQQIQSVLKALPAAQWHQFDPAGPHAARSAAGAIFGKPVNTYFNLAGAGVVLALDADFLACGPESTRYAHDFADRRRRGDRLDMNRLYVIESTMTATGGKADHRLTLRYLEVETFARELAGALGLPGGSTTSSYTALTQAVAKDLKSHAGSCVVIPGERQTPALHALSHAINHALGNTGKTAIYTDAIEVEPVDQIESLRQLNEDMHAGKVELLLILGGNPVYNAPVDFAIAKGLQKVKTSVHCALHFNETSLKTTWHIPESHFLEEWADARSYDGTVSIMQPLIAPLYDTRSHLTLLDAILQFPGRSSYEIVRQYWSAHCGAVDFEQWWRKSVHDGLIAGSALPPLTPTIRSTSFPPAASQQSAIGLEIVFRPDVYLYDGRYANNIWLQELPRPMTKLTWDNAVFLSPATAKRLELKSQQHVEVRYGNRSTQGSVWILPGHPDESIGLDLGFGRTHSGRAGNGAGFNAYLLRTAASLWVGTGAEIQKLDSSYPLATTQMQQTMEHRDVVLSSTLDEYKRNPDVIQEKNHRPPENLTLYPQWQYSGYKWAMSIDLTACVNCNACVIACQAENNIPVVGKEQVLARRAMHWLRIDTYFKGDPRIPQAVYQPVPCMQCENAPCELVCPVQATNHSSDGLNDMVYNRCVGTRYCSNNCPYKVRRFNFLLYQDWTTETLKMQRNPDVTVRSRGVMEKCTYCVQRIREAEITSQVEDRFIRDGEIQTACQQACPTDAIVFGDMNNRGNRVAKRKVEKLDYSLLAELNTRPRTTYLAELRNPNPEWPGEVTA
jgi:Fe-S-cluster-containing dehydrogenase component/anaerobic selenocysteine-containing dehydrogenase